jgi:hypothetical protein
VDPRLGPCGALTGAWLAGAAEPGSSPWVGEKGEELRGVLTEGFGGRFDGEARPAAMKGERRRRSSMRGDQWRREWEMGAGVSAVRRGELLALL